MRDARTAITLSSRVPGLKGYMKGILGKLGELEYSVSDVQGASTALASRGSLAPGKFTLKHLRVGQDGEREGQRAQGNTGISGADRLLEGGAQRLWAGKPGPPGQEASVQGTKLMPQPHGSPGLRPNPAASVLCVCTNALTPLGLFFHGLTDSACFLGLLRKLGVKRRASKSSWYIVSAGETAPQGDC